MKKRVVVTGMGVISPNAIGVDQFRNSLQNGISGIKYSKELENLNYFCRVAGMPALEHSYIQEKLPKYYSRKIDSMGIIYACLAGLEAWQMAGNKTNGENRLKDVGIVFGSGSLGLDSSIGERINKIDDGKGNSLNSTSITQGMNSGAAAYLNQLIGAGYQVTSNSSACITGSEAILLGYEKVASGEVSTMICGSTEGEGRYMWAGFDAMRVLCADSNANPTFASRPMSNTSSGFVPGSGSGAIVIESLDSAKKRNAKIFAEIVGGHRNCGGMRNGGNMTAQNPEAAAECVSEAVRKSGVNPREIDLLSGHLTSTMADFSEIENCVSGLGINGSDFPMINAPKSMIGHCLGAAGSIESVAVILQIYHGFVHKNINLTEENVHPGIKELIPASCIPTETQNKEIKTAIKTNFGFGDLNCSLIFRKYSHDGQNQNSI